MSPGAVNETMSILDCKIQGNYGPAGTNSTSGIQCEGVRMVRNGTSVTNNSIGGVASAAGQILCNACPGCMNLEGFNYLWLLLIVPVLVIVALVVYFVRRPSPDYQNIN